MATTATRTTPMEATATTSAPPVASSKTPSRPALLTLTGLYQTSKSVYVSYMPEVASKTVESLTEKLLAMSSPYVASIHKALPKGAADKGQELKAADEDEAKEEPIELSVAKLDALVASLCSQADSRVDDLIATATAKFSSAKSKTQAMVHSTLGSQRVVAVQERCADAYEDLTSRASTYYSTAQEYTPAARHVAVQYTQIVQSEVKTKGVLGTAKLALVWARDQAASAVSILRREGLVAGTKTILTGVWGAVTSTLHRARLEAVAPVLDEDEDVASARLDEAQPTTTTGGDHADPPVAAVDEGEQHQQE